MKNILTLLFFTQILVIICYSQMNQQWVSIYDNPANIDYPTGIAVDGAGNVYTTAWTYDSTHNYNISSDIITIKYNSSGVEQWTRIYSGPADSFSYDRPVGIGVDAIGNIYVAGWTRSGLYRYNYVTIKYDSFGTLLWEQRYTSAGFNRAMKVDASGNVYVTGRGGNIANNTDYLTIKYNSSGTMLWVQNYNSGPAHQDEAYAITTDNIGNVYITGTSLPAPGSWDYLTVKYNSSGAQQWVKTYDGPAGTTDEAYFISPDNMGNVYVSGKSGFVSNPNIATIKYNSSGNQEWVRIYDGNPPVNGTLDSPTGSYADAFGNFYVLGYSSASGGRSALIKYNHAGDSVFVRTSPSGTSLTFDNCLGYLYVTGGFNNGIRVARYNLYGDSLWSGTYDNLPNYIETTVSSVTDGLGNLYALEMSYGGYPGKYGMITSKYTPSSFFIHTPAKKNVGKAINDNQSTSDSIFIDCSLMNYTIADVNVKLDTIIHTRDSDLEIYLIHNSPTDNTVTVDTLVYQAGGTGQNFFGTILNDSASIPISSGTAPFTGTFRPRSPLSIFNGQGINGSWVLRIYDRATGNTGILKAWSINFLLSANPIGIQSISNEIPGQYSLSQNYPNPFNPVTNINFQMPKPGFVKLTVYDMLGREIETLVNKNLNAGTYNAEWNASNQSSGVYFYKLETSEFSEIKKMVLVK